MELRRGRAPPRLASDLQRHERPLRDRVHRDGPEGAHRGGERPSRRDSRQRRRDAHVSLDPEGPDPQLPGHRRRGGALEGPAPRSEDPAPRRGTRSQGGAARRLDASRDGRGRAVRLREHARHGRVLLDEDGLSVPLGQVRPGGAPRVLRRDGDDDRHGILGVGAAPRRRPARPLSGLRVRLADLHVRGRRGPRARAPLVRRPRDLPLARLDLAQRVLRHLLAHDVEREGSRRRRPDLSALGVSRPVRRLRARDRQRPADGVSAAGRNRPRCTRRRRRT